MKDIERKEIEQLIANIKSLSEANKDKLLYFALGLNASSSNIV